MLREKKQLWGQGTQLTVRGFLTRKRTLVLLRTGCENFEGDVGIIVSDLSHSPRGGE